MGIVKTRRCDVTGTAIGVKSYEVVLTEVKLVEGPPGEDETTEPVEAIRQIVLDLAPRGLKRLKAFIDKGTATPPGFKRKKPDEASDPIEGEKRV